MGQFLRYQHTHNQTNKAKHFCETGNQNCLLRLMGWHNNKSHPLLFYNCPFRDFVTRYQVGFSQPKNVFRHQQANHYFSDVFHMLDKEGSLKVGNFIRIRLSTAQWTESLRGTKAKPSRFQIKIQWFYDGIFDGLTVKFLIQDLAFSKNWEIYASCNLFLTFY